MFTHMTSPHVNTWGGGVTQLFVDNQSSEYKMTNALCISVLQMVGHFLPKVCATFVLWARKQRHILHAFSQEVWSDTRKHVLTFDVYYMFFGSAGVLQLHHGGFTTCDLMQTSVFLEHFYTRFNNWWWF